ncbi:SpoVR family protein [Kroppenstedtia pulmonis]|uniref:SpoVR family protein n=1 Tax=Kroppenstedtia pulmonis TaxID=1380685 RepID=A0A7D3XHT0_9BACL|nr:SpoVR family protein [Kroppenstedtia pulmonis]QKG83924.1 SpoVR family protein [Kroppenstedtia pulmonis]
MTFSYLRCIAKAFHRMKTDYDLDLGRIYELVINSNPCYAFLLEGNSLIQNKLIIAHVLAHSDFFKNNVRFSNTSRDMVESMAASAERIRRYEMDYGKDQVEAFLDHVLAIQEHIDPGLIRRPRKKEKSSSSDNRHSTPYDDLWALERREEDKNEQKSGTSKVQEKDILLFAMENNPKLQDWQQDILTVMRDEMLYFWPQLETKIMNEGWASYWHIRILREMNLTNEEVLEFAKLNALVTQPSSGSINPYHLGLKIFEDIERRWDHPTEDEQVRFGRKPGQGRQKIFDVREMEMDTSFIRNYLTRELTEEMDLYIFQRKGAEWTVTDKEWQKVREQLIASRVNGGYPYIVVEDGDYQDKGELYLRHRFEEMELDIKYVEKTLPHVHALWGRPVHIETVVENRPVLFTYNGKRCSRRFL